MDGSYMEGTYLDASKAPRPGKKPTTKQGRASQELLAGLTVGTVLQIKPREGQTVRGVKVSLTRAAKSLGKTIETWDVDGVVYAKLADD